MLPFDPQPAMQLDLFANERADAKKDRPAAPKRAIRYKKIAENVIRFPARSNRTLTASDTPRAVYFHTRLFRSFRLRAIEEILSKPIGDQAQVSRKWERAFRSEMAAMGFTVDAIDRQAANFSYLLDSDLRQRVFSLLTTQHSGGAA